MFEIKNVKVPFYEIVLGVAGVGKSTLINSIVQAGLRHFKSFLVEDPSSIKILLGAPRGKAAFNISGMTLHSVFHLPLNQNSLKPLSDDICNQLSAKLVNLKLIIIDEISMVKLRDFYFVENRLRQIIRDNFPFGGVSIIVLGDFWQLRPVMRKFVFTNPEEVEIIDIDKKKLFHIYLWHKFSLYKLTKIIRQQNDCAFAEALSNMAVAAMTEKDITLIKSCKITSANQPPINAISFF